MKVIKKCLFLIIGLLSISSCGNNMEGNTLKNPEIIEKYKEYYQYGEAAKGIEVYAWKESSDWFCVLTGGTNMLKTTYEIKKLQDDLPCPINTMKEILKSYNKTFAIPYVARVSNPPKEEELTHNFDVDTLKSDNEFLEILMKLGISSKDYFNQNSNYENNSNESSDNKSETDETFLVKTIPNSFTFHDTVYVDKNIRVDNNRIGQLLGYIIRQDDIDDFLKMYPNNEYVIYDSVFDYYNKNRVPFFSIKDDDDLKYICCNNELYVKEEIYVE